MNSINRPYLWIAILLALSAFAVPVYAETVLVTAPNGGELISGEYRTAFTVSGSGSYSAAMFYNAMAMQGSGTEIAKIEDTRNSAACSISGGATTCSWPWNTTAVGSGKYYFTVKVSGGGAIECSDFPCMGNFRDNTSHALFAANINCWQSTFWVPEPCYGETMRYCSNCCNDGVYGIYNNFNGTYDVVCNGSLKKTLGFEISDISDARFTVDNSPPVIESRTPAAGGYSNNPLQEITIGLSDACSDVNSADLHLHINGIKYSNGIGPELIYDARSGILAFVPSAPFADGEISIAVEASDIAGNRLTPQSEGASWSFIVDTKAPDAVIENENADWNSSDEIDIACREAAGESGCDSTYWYEFSGSQNADDCQASYEDYDFNGTLDSTNSGTLTVSSDANNYLCLLASDRAGNFGRGVSQRFRVDATAPNTTASAPTTWQNVAVDVNFTCADLGYMDGSGDESGSGCAATHYRINSGGWNEGNRANVSTDGNNRIDYYSVDNAGNNGATNAVWAAVDRTAPSGAISGIESQWVTSDEITVSCTDETSGCREAVAYYFDDDGICDENLAIYGGSTATGKITVDWDENRHLCILTEDVAGNRAVTASATSLMVDATAPQTTADYNGEWQSADVNLHLACTDAGSGCALTQYRLDANADNTDEMEVLQNYDTNILLITDGNWAVDFNSTDNLGHAEDTKTVYALIDKTPPTINIDSSAASGSDVTIEYAGSDALSGISRYEVRTDSGEWMLNSLSTAYTFVSQSNGSHEYSVRAYDLAGNFAEASVTVTVFTGGGGGDGDDDDSDGDSSGGSGGGGGGGGGGGARGDADCKPAPVGLGIGVSGWLCAADEECVGGIHWASPKVSGATCCSITCARKAIAITAPAECADAGGFACSAGETCEGTLLEASDTTACCSAVCEPKPPAGFNCTKQGCDDGNPCTIDSCNEISGICSYSIVENGVPCGAGMECRNGRCVAVETVSGEIEGPTALAILSPASITAGLLLLALAVMMYATHRKRRAARGEPAKEAGA